MATLRGRLGCPTTSPSETILIGECRAGLHGAEDFFGHELVLDSGRKGDHRLTWRVDGVEIRSVEETRCNAMWAKRVASGRYPNSRRTIRILAVRCREPQHMIPSVGSRILIVEDEDAIADYLVRGLREEGFAVDRASNAEEGWDYLQVQTWDVVLLDWSLPGTDGLSLLKRFRQTDQSTPVLFLTAHDAVSDRVRGLDCGADDYLCKPFAFDELLARIRAITRRHERIQGTILSYGNVRVDLATHRAERAGHRLDLTAKEHALLVYFLRHTDEVLTRTRIYEQVWDDRYDGLSNTLEVHVMELRKKLEAHGDRLIHTLRNRGYIFGTDPR